MIAMGDPNYIHGIYRDPLADDADDSCGSTMGVWVPGVPCRGVLAIKNHQKPLEIHG